MRGESSSSLSILASLDIRNGALATAKVVGQNWIVLGRHFSLK
jgi:hypothetical protein